MDLFEFVSDVSEWKSNVDGSYLFDQQATQAVSYENDWTVLKLAYLLCIAILE